MTGRCRSEGKRLWKIQLEKAHEGVRRILESDSEFYSCACESQKLCSVSAVISPSVVCDQSLERRLLFFTALHAATLSTMLRLVGFSSLRREEEYRTRTYAHTHRCIIKYRFLRYFQRGQSIASVSGLCSLVDTMLLIHCSYLLLFVKHQLFEHFNFVRLFASVIHIRHRALLRDHWPCSTRQIITSVSLCRACDTLVCKCVYRWYTDTFSVFSRHDTGLCSCVFVRNCIFQ